MKEVVIRLSLRDGIMLHAVVMVAQDHLPHRREMIAPIQATIYEALVKAGANDD
jgi:hypothetical protein